MDPQAFWQRQDGYGELSWNYLGGRMVVHSTNPEICRKMLSNDSPSDLKMKLHPNAELILGSNPHPELVRRAASTFTFIMQQHQQPQSQLQQPSQPLRYSQVGAKTSSSNVSNSAINNNQSLNHPLLSTKLLLEKCVLKLFVMLHLDVLCVSYPFEQLSLHALEFCNLALFLVAFLFNFFQASLIVRRSSMDPFLLYL